MWFQITYVSSTDSASDVVVPFLSVPINASDCMCRSLTDLADNVRQTSYIPSCVTNDDCNGVLCLVTIPSGRYYIEIVILPCDNAVELVVEDSNFAHLFSTVLNETGSQDLLIGGSTIGSNVVIIPGDYSMNFSVSF